MNPNYVKNIFVTWLSLRVLRGLCGTFLYGVPAPFVALARKRGKFAKDSSDHSDAMDVGTAW
jgi:3-deoxy-D-arabino-heptulosonate 7-phosphate (DAHP) synthase class II